MWPCTVWLSVRVRECDVRAIEGDEKIGCVPNFGEGVDDGRFAGSWEYALVVLRMDRGRGWGLQHLG